MKRRSSVSAAAAAIVAIIGGAGLSLAQQPGSVAHTNLKVGDTAPDFTMPDNTNKPVHLADFRGKKNVILAFYVLAFTGG